MKRLALLLAACAACQSDSGQGDDQGNPIPPPPSENPIDVAIWPRLVATQMTVLPPASNAELCRRMSLDLTGIAPDAQVVADNCTGKSAEQMARAFLASPRFKTVELRYWVRRLGANPIAMMANHIKDADRIIEAAAGGMPYDDFVAQLVAHPVITVNRPVAAGNDPTMTVQRIFTTFLGRLPSIVETADFANLLRPWRRRFEDRYDQGYGYYVYPAALDPNACRDPVLGVAACTSTQLGKTVTVNPTVMPLVPPGYAQTSSALFYYEMVEGHVPAAVQAELEKPGRLLATRAELWEEAADLALARYLGWWRSTPNVPDTVLPEVRKALADWFRATSEHDLRELYVTVLTSLLYTTSAEITASGDRPPWATGPSKLLEPEQMLDSVGLALERQVGLCDPHTDEPVGRNFYWPNRMRTPQPADFYGFGYDFYYERAQQLGGCLGAIAAPTSPGLPALLTHIDLARDLCTTPSKLLPAGVSGSDTTAEAGRAVADHLFTRLLARAPADDERAAIDTAVTACLADTNCRTANKLAEQLCGAIVRSTAFLYY